MNYKVVILDLDNTLIDFDYMEDRSLKAMLDHFNVSWDAKMVEDYKIINQNLWEGLEKGLYKKSEILIKRFDDLKNKYNLTYDSNNANDYYLSGMANYTKYLPYGLEILEKLSGKCTLVMLTNGVEEAQNKKIDKLGLRAYFDAIIISETVNLHKPDIKIFEYMSDQIGMTNKEEMIIIGDSISSDIQGGINYSIDTCYYNPQNKMIPNHINVQYEIASLEELTEILGLT